MGMLPSPRAPLVDRLCLQIGSASESADIQGKKRSAAATFDSSACMGLVGPPIKRLRLPAVPRLHVAALDTKMRDDMQQVVASMGADFMEVDGGDVKDNAEEETRAACVFGSRRLLKVKRPAAGQSLADRYSGLLQLLSQRPAVPSWAVPM